MSAVRSGGGRLHLLDDLFVEGDVLRNYLIGAVTLDRKFAAHVRRSRDAALRPATSTSVSAVIFAVSPTSLRKPVSPSLMTSGMPPIRVAMTGSLAGLGLESGKAERFQFGRQEKNVGNAKVIGDVCLFADKHDVVRARRAVRPDNKRPTAPGRRRP